MALTATARRMPRPVDGVLHLNKMLAAISPFPPPWVGNKWRACSIAAGLYEYTSLLPCAVKGFFYLLMPLQLMNYPAARPQGIKNLPPPLTGGDKGEGEKKSL